MVQIGGVRAPSPVGELGNVEMTQALSIVEPHWQGIGQDMLLTGYLPASGGLEALDSALSGLPPLQMPPPTPQSNGSSPSGLAPDLSPRGKARRRGHPDSKEVPDLFLRHCSAHGMFNTAHLGGTYVSN